MTTYGIEKENIAAFKDYVEYMENRYKVKVKIVRSDNELFTKRTRAWLRKKAIDADLSAPRTQAQNGLTERSGGVVIAKAREKDTKSRSEWSVWGCRHSQSA
jgi:hypothetical protein